MSLEVEIAHNLGNFELKAGFSSQSGVTALFGPSGSGKTTLVNIIAGLIRPEQGKIILNGETVLDTAAGIDRPSHRRRIGYVFQDARLFPHLSVAANLTYGRAFAPRAQRMADIAPVVDLLGIGHLLKRSPKDLSGGEKQRVAIGRALISSPRLIIMDEPLASLDEARKNEILPYLERLRDETNIPVIYVSHAVREVTRLAGQVVLMADGRVTASGPAAQTMGRLDLSPLSGDPDAGAVLEATVLGHDPDYALTTLRLRGGIMSVPLAHIPSWDSPRNLVQQSVRLRVSARDIIVSRGAPANLSALNAWPGTILAIDPHGPGQADIRIDCNGDILIARLTRKAVDTLALRIGDEVHAIVKSVSLEPG